MSGMKASAMDYRTLLVHLDSDEHCDARLKLAAELAREHDAHVMGLAVIGTAAVETLAQHFRGRMEDLGVASFAARLEEGAAHEVVARHAGRADLVILSQAGTSGTVPADFVHRVFMAAARPVLLVPDRCELQAAGGHVLVAWNGTPSAVRAIADALPWLRRASAVTVLCLDRQEEALFGRLELNDLRDWLKRHGVAAQVVQHPALGSVAMSLLSWIRNSPCDLLVMGGYGHAPATELVFGGVTRSVLAEMPVPVLISHG